MGRRTRHAVVAVLLAVSVMGLVVGGRAFSETTRRAEASLAVVRPGVTLSAAGQTFSLGGLSRTAAEEEVLSASAEASAAVLVLVRDGASGHETPLASADLGWQDNATELQAAAWNHGRSGAGDFWRAFRERFLAEVPPPLVLSLEGTCSPGAIAVAAEAIAAAASRVPQDDSRLLDGRTPVVVSGSDGYSVEASAVASAILAAAEALDPAAGSLEASAAYMGQAIPHKTLPNDALVVDRASRTVTLWLAGERIRSYDIAVGTAAYPTPAGDWEVTLLRKNPTWVNPAPNGWGADMPASIPPGPDNPLGVRAINISASGIRFHGTTAENTVGTAASHGCMRMRKDDVLDLFERVYVGMPVYIR